MNVDAVQTTLMALAFALELFVETHALYRLYYPVRSRDKPTRDKHDDQPKKKKKRRKRKKRKKQKNK